MDTMLVRERYKVVQVLDVRENYAFVEAVDILDREKNSCLLNIYEGPLLRAYLPCFDRLDACPDFQGDRHPWRERLAYAQELLHQVLNMADLPAQVSCAALLSENVLVDERNHEIHLRFQVAPMEEMNGRELVYLACDQLRKILLPRFSAPREQLEFLDLLEEGGCTTAVQLYSLWRERQPVIQEAYEKLEKRNFFRRWCALLWGHFRHWAARRKRR